MARTGTEPEPLRESLPYRVAGILLLLLAQPLVKIAALRIDDILLSPTEFRIRLGKDPTPIPEPFAVLIREHAKHRPNLATGNGPSSPWLFPGYRAGTHLHPDTIMIRLRELGISLLGARNRALAELVTEVPPSLVADALGYSRQVAFRHAQAAGDPWARYVGNRKAP
jgi:integrase